MFNIGDDINLEGDLDDIRQKSLIVINQMYAEKVSTVQNVEIQKLILLKSIDYSWKEHLYGIDGIRNKISLRSYAQKDPFNEYKLELFKAFEEMFLNYRKLVIINTFKREF